MGKAYIVSIDQSTQGTKAVLLDEKGHFLMRRDLSHRQIIDGHGWVSHDPMEIGRNIFAAVKLLLTDSGADPSCVAAVAVTNQRESVAVWDRKTGEPVCDSIVWQCSRASELYREIESAGHYPLIRERTGLMPSPYFSAGKIAWILRNIPGAYQRAVRGELCAGTMDTWTIWNLTGGREHKTDCSNASRTQLFDIRTLEWDVDLCRIFDIPMSMLPEVQDTDSCFGYTDLGGLLPKKVSIHAAIGDSHGAMFAHGCLEPGSCMAGHGTGTCIMMNTGEILVESTHGVNTALAWRIDGKSVYALEGVVNNAGAVTTWLKDSLGLIRTPTESESLCRSANPGDTTYLVPAFTGIGAPYWDDEARACFVGMSRLTGKAELVKAGIESIGYQVADIVRAMERDAGYPVSEVRMAGGPANNRYLMQFQSDVMALPTVLGQHEELVAIGAGQIAGVAMGMYDLQYLEQTRKKQYFYPEMEENTRQRKLNGWWDAIGKTLSR